MMMIDKWMRIFNVMKMKWIRKKVLFMKKKDEQVEKVEQQTSRV